MSRPGDNPRCGLLNIQSSVERILCSLLLRTRRALHLASRDGASGYELFSDITQGLNDWDGQFYSASQWAAFLQNRVDALQEAIADMISHASNSVGGENWDTIYNNLEYVGTSGGNADFAYNGSVINLGLSFPLGDNGTGCE